MKRLLAATVVLVAGCSFESPRVGADAAGVPDATPIDAPRINPECDGYDILGGHGYRLVTRSMSWMDAKAGCEADGGYLLKLDTTQEDDGAAQYIGEQTEVWIGLHDADQAGTYLWTDRTPPTFTHWATPPTATSPDCVFKNTLVANGQWYTLPCTDLRPSVCECTPVPVP